MKSLIYALMSLLSVLAAVIITTVLLSGSLREIEMQIESCMPTATSDLGRVADDFTDIKNSFSEKLSALSLIVSDTALLEIEHSFSDIINYANTDSIDGVMTSVGRLKISIEHLRELAGFNIKSVF